MKPFFIILIFLSFTFTAFGQQPEYPDSGFTNKAEAKNLMVNGKREGKWVEYRNISDIGDNITTDTNAPRYVLTNYRRGIPNGIQRWYNKNGGLEETIPFTDSNINGIMRFYYKSGKIEIEVPYTNGFEDGIQKEYYKNGILKKESPYLHSKKNGMENRYYESGKLEETIPYINGLENGVSKWYYENGKIKGITTYINGTAGVTTIFDKNGNEIMK